MTDFRIKFLVKSLQIYSIMTDFRIKFLVKSLQIYSIKGFRTLKVQVIGRLNPQNNLKE